MRRQRHRALLARAGLLAMVTWLAGCGAIKKAAIKSVADTLSTGSGDVFTRDDDPDLVRDAVPFGLKTYESLLESIPDYVPLLTATCASFTQYAYSFVQPEAERLEADDFAEFRRQRDRALRLYARARGYCFRALEERFEGITARLIRDPAPALTRTEERDIELLYWTAASWGAGMGLDPDLAIDLPAVRALIERALVLDEDWERGALHEMMITIESLGTGLGGSEERARAHFARAVELQDGTSPGPYVALAMGVAVPNQNREEFETLLEEALAIDPEDDPSRRLVTLLAQRRARVLLDQADRYIPKDDNTEAGPCGR